MPAEQDFLTLVALEQQRLRNLIRTHVEDATRREDVLQDVLLEAWKSYPKFRADAAFSTWLYRIALNVIYLSYRRVGRSPKLVTTPPAQLDSPAPSEPASPQVERLRRAISRLQPVDKTIVTAHLDGYRNPEIADITGLSANHVGVRLHRIKTQLTRDLNPDAHG